MARIPYYYLCHVIMACIIVIIISVCNCTGRQIISPIDAMKYLQNFGYIPHENNSTTNMFSNGLSMFQMFAGLRQSGKFDDDTRYMMNMPRCGMAEKIDSMENKYLKLNRRPIHRLRKWGKSKIYYKIGNFPQSFGMNESTVKVEIRRAFRLWEDVANIRCVELVDNDSKKETEIDIFWKENEHGDQFAFGNKVFANIVAHAFYPTHRVFAGDIHFDDSRLWTAYSTEGLNLFQIAAHEVGHALGLDHSRFPDSVMHMIVKGEFQDTFKLHEDDIKGIQRLYGPRRRTGRKHVPFHGPDKDDQPTSAKHQLNRNFGHPVAEEEKAMNAIIKVSVDNESGASSQLVPTLSNFWKCAQLNLDGSESSKQKMGSCYKQNVISLLYSLKLV